MGLPTSVLVWLVYACTSDQYGTEKLVGVYDSFMKADEAEKSILGYQVRTKAVRLNEEQRWRP